MARKRHNVQLSEKEQRQLDARIVTRLRAGVSTHAIHKSTGVSTERIRKIAEANGIAPPDKRTAATRAVWS